MVSTVSDAPAVPPGGAPSAAADVARRLVRDEPSFHLDGHRVWNALPGTLEAIARMVRPGDHTLETGAGASTVVFAAAGASHLAISPAADEHQRIREYCRTIGVADDTLDFAVGASSVVLPRLPGDVVLDAAFVDGRHSFPDPVVDCFFAAAHLRVGGLLMMDDVPIPAVRVMYEHLLGAPEWELVEVVDNRAAIFRKLAEPDPDDNWRRQPMNRSYPDYSFVELRERVGLEVGAWAAATRRRLGDRIPALRRIRNRLRRP